MPLLALPMVRAVLSSRPIVPPPVPDAPLLEITSSVVDNKPDYALYGDFLAGDFIQFEQQLAGGDWSAATVAIHTLTTAEVGGANISLGFSALANGDYEARVKYRHDRSGWSAYSNVVPFSVAVSTAAYSFRGASNGDTASNSNGTDTQDFTIDIGAASADKILLVGLTIANVCTISSLTLDPTGSNIALVRDDIYQPGYTLAFFRASVPSLSGPLTLRLTTVGAAWVDRDISVWSLTGLTSAAPQVTNRHDAGGAATNTITADPGDLLFAIACVFAQRTWDGSSEAPALGGGSNHYSPTFHSSADFVVQGSYPSDGFSLVTNSACYQIAQTFR